MEQKPTDELLDDLLSSPSLDAFVQANELPSCTLAEYLQQMLAQKGLSQPTVVRMANLSDAYGYQIFAGIRQHPSRDKVLQIAFATGSFICELDIAEADRARCFPAGPGEHAAHPVEIAILRFEELLKIHKSAALRENRHTVRGAGADLRFHLLVF